MPTVEPINAEVDDRHWFEPLADHLGDAYLRYSFTKSTVREVDALVQLLDLQPGDSVLDIGCGPGRHSHELARRGCVVTGVDISERFCEIARRDAPEDVRILRRDARALDFDAQFDAAFSLCQGAFGLGWPAADDDPQLLAADTDVLEGLRRALRPRGRYVFSAFSAYFQVANLEECDDFDAATGVNHELTEVRDEHGTAVPARLWTTCYTPRELRLLAERAGLVVDRIVSVEPGTAALSAPSILTPEFLVIGHRS